MRKTNTKPSAKVYRRPTIWERQGKSTVFDSFPALYPYNSNFFEIK